MKAGCRPRSIAFVGLTEYLALFLVGSLLICQTNGATFVVTNTLDSGPGSLRASISNANANAGADTIDCTSMSGAITLASPLPELSGDTSIIGPGASLLTVSGGNSNRVFQVDANAIVSISDLAIANGYTTNTGGAGILNAGNLTLRRCSVLRNMSISVPGGGIWNQGTLSLISSLLASNVAGGAGFPFGSPCLTFGLDPSGHGGGLYVQSGTVTISNCLVTSNQALGTWIFYGQGYGLGGAICVEAGQITIVNSTLSSNLAVGGYGGNCQGDFVGYPGGDGYGGAMFVASNTFAHVELLNCTIA